MFLTKLKPDSSHSVLYAVAAFLIIISFIISRYNYLFFHSLVEIYSIVIAVSVFTIKWNSKREITGSFFIILAASMLFTAIIDVLHVVTYEGMNILQIRGPGTTTQLWVAGRYTITAGIVAGLIFRNIVIRKEIIFFAFGAAAFVLIGSVYMGFFPECYIAGYGLTDFKIMSELATVLITGMSALYIRHYCERNTLNSYIVYALGFFMVSELCFALYSDVYGAFNFMGHIFKLFSYHCFYAAFVKRIYTDPLESLTHQRFELLQKYESIFNSGSDAIIIHQRKEDFKPFLIVDANEEACRMTGFTRDELLGMSRIEIEVGLSVEKLNNISTEVTKQGRYIYEAEIVSKNGSSTPAEVNLKRHIINGEEIVVGTIRDISGRRKAERERIEADTYAAQQSKMVMVGEMMGAIAHQWKQPLNTIAILAQSMDDFECETAAGKQEKDETIKAIMDNIVVLSKTIDNFRNFIKPMDDSEKFHILRSVLQTASIFTPQFAKNNIFIEIYCKLKGEYPVYQKINFSSNVDFFNAGGEKDCSSCKLEEAYICGSENNFKNIIMNLLTNAKEAILESKNSDKGVIIINIYRKDDNTFVTVTDNGGGIPEDKKDKMFNRFFTTKGEKGTGIGLYLVKKLMEEHFGGKVSFSNTDAGASFTLKFPSNFKSPE
jgi:PAS domain S-box-containing protein